MRDKIISEIKRIVEQTGQVPGSKTFSNSTGIFEKDWKGVLWARWGDALVDAGFEPNKFSEKYDTETLLRAYCEATRKFKKPPTKDELRMYSKQVENFPSYNAMWKPFGSMANLRVKAREWAELNANFFDVVDFLPERIEPREQLSRIDERKEGWVYLLKSGSHYKIGRGENLERRVKQVSVALPDKVTLVHSIRTDDPSGIETYWHQRFKEKRANGEWFTLNSHDVRAFKRRTFQ